MGFLLGQEPHAYERGGDTNLLPRRIISAEPMFILRDSILVEAPIERVFALSTSVAIVERELGMRPVAVHPSEQ